jgi:ABC-2 type transport system permease protein
MKPRAIWRAALAPMVAALPVLGLGTYAGLSLKHGHEGEPAKHRAISYWKRNSRTWEDAPSPALDRIDGEVKLEPASRALEVNATYVLRNLHAEPLPEIALTVGAHLTSSDWTIDGVAVHPDAQRLPEPSIEDRNGLYVLHPRNALRPNETLSVSFRLRGKLFDGWSRLGATAGEFLLPSGVFLKSNSTTFLPAVGFRNSLPAGDERSRDAREFPVDHWNSVVESGAGAGNSKTHVRLVVEAPSTWTVNAAGVPKESTQSNGMIRTLWETEHPVHNFVVVGGPLLVKPVDGGKVFYSSTTPYKVDVIANGLAEARRHYGAWFGDVPSTEFRITEFPGLAPYAMAVSGNIGFSESMGFLSNALQSSFLGVVRQASSLDAASIVVAHEVAHQWWGLTLVPGNGPGAPVLSEGLAHFSALLLAHRVYGEDVSTTLRRSFELEYVLGRRPDTEYPMRLATSSDIKVNYERAGFVFWMLRDLMGEDAILAGLRAFLATWKDGVKKPEGLDFPLLEDLMESLRPHAPDPARFDRFVDTWMYKKTLPLFTVRDTSVTQDASSNSYITGGSLLNESTDADTQGSSFEVELRLAATPRYLGGPPEAFEDVSVQLSGNPPTRFRLRTKFKPKTITVDPSVKLLMLGRSRSETSL